MANTIVSIIMRPGRTSHVIKLFQADTLVNTSGGDALTAGSNDTTLYTATVTEAVVGDVSYSVEDAAGNKVNAGVIYGMADDTNTYPCQDPGVASVGDVTLAASQPNYAPATASALATISATLDLVYNHVQGENITYGTIGLTGNDATHLHLSGVTYADDYLNDFRIVVLDISAGMHYVTWITDWVNSTALATVEALPFTPEASTDLYWIVPVRKNDLGLNSLYDAAKTAAQAGDEMDLVDDAITSGKFDESTAFPITAANGSQFTEAGGDGDHLTAINLPNQTMDITGSLSGSVGSVTGAVGSVTGNVGGNVAGSVGSVTAGVTLADDAITAAKFDESTAFPITAANGSQFTEAGGTGDHLTDVPKTGFKLASDGLDLTQLHLDWLNGGRLDALLDSAIAKWSTAMPELTSVSDIPADATPTQVLMLLYMWLRNNTQDTATLRKILNDAGTVVLQSTMSDDGTTFTQGKLGNP